MVFKIPFFKSVDPCLSLNHLLRLKNYLPSLPLSTSFSFTIFLSGICDSIHEAIDSRSYSTQYTSLTCSASLYLYTWRSSGRDRKLNISPIGQIHRNLSMEDAFVTWNLSIYVNSTVSLFVERFLEVQMYQRCITET